MSNPFFSNFGPFKIGEILQEYGYNKSGTEVLYNGRTGQQIETQIFKNCEHRIPTEGSSLGLQFIKKQFNS